MTFRTRLLIVLLPAVLVPIAVLMMLVRGEMTARLSDGYERQMETVLTRIDADLDDMAREIDDALGLVASGATDDNRFRRAILGLAPGDRTWLLDFASVSMRTAGLDLLQIQDESGRILSSGHFRNEFDREETWVVDSLALLSDEERTLTLLRARSAGGPFLAFVRAFPFKVADRTLFVLGGVNATTTRLESLAGPAEISVGLSYPGGFLGTDSTGTHPFVERLRSVPFVDVAAPVGSTAVAPNTAQNRAAIRIHHDTTELADLRADVNRWSLLALLGAALLVGLAVSLAAAGVARPLAALARKTDRIDLDRLDTDFSSDRTDEIGALSRMLSAMTRRLRTSALRVREAERRATLGEIARQVNHDVRNGLTPIRNVVRHLEQVADDGSGSLPDIFRDRRDTLASSIAYLEDLANRYAGLSSEAEIVPCDLAELAHRVAGDQATSKAVTIRATARGRTRVLVDPLAVRRILENLVANARDSIAKRGTIDILCEATTGDNGDARVRLTVRDTGSGMTPEVMDRIFDQFYTTKASGTGLGLPIVRRLVTDFHGTIRVESDLGAGSAFILDFPAAPDEPSTR